MSKFIDFIGRFGKLGAGVADALIPVENALSGLIGFITKLAGPLSWLLTLSGDSPAKSVLLDQWKRVLQLDPGANVPDDVRRQFNNQDIYRDLQRNHGHTSVTVTNPHFHFPAGTPTGHAEAFYDAIKDPASSLRTGSIPSHPKMSRFAAQH